MKALTAAGTALLLCSSSPLLAQTERELDAHEHGAARALLESAEQPVMLLKPAR